MAHSVTTPHHQLRRLPSPGLWSAGEYLGPVTVTLSATDNASGVAHTYYKVDGGSYIAYSGPFAVATVGAHTVFYYSVDVAGNTETAKSIGFNIGSTLTTGLLFVPVTPCRVADTRNPTGPFGGPIMTGGSTRSFAIPAGPCSIPSTALAYSLNVTVVPSGPLGYLSIWPTGAAQPLVSTMNSDGRFKANAATVPAGTSGAVNVYVTDTTQVVLDIDGYYVQAGSASGLEFYPLAPCRVADTRNAAGPLGGPFLAGGSSRALPRSLEYLFHPFRCSRVLVELHSDTA